MACKMCSDNLPREFVAGRWMHRKLYTNTFFDCGFQEGAPTRLGDWIQTFTGRQFFARDPRPEDFHILDIAAGLRNARYSCQSIRVQTVAEHSSCMRRVAATRGYSKELQRAVLLHDASEAYLVDIPRPIKRDLTNYVEIEDGIMRACAQRFDFPYPLPPEVKALDSAIIFDEQRQNMAPPPAEWRQPVGAPLGIAIPCWDSDRAMIEFLFDAAQVGAF